MGALLSADQSAGALGFLWPSIGRLGIFAYMGVGVDTLGTLGYTAAIQYVIVVSVGLVRFLLVVVAGQTAHASNERPRW